MVGVVLRFAVIHGSFSPIDVPAWTNLCTVSYPSSPHKFFFNTIHFKKVFDFWKLDPEKLLLTHMPSVRIHLTRSRPRLCLGGVFFKYVRNFSSETWGFMIQFDCIICFQNGLVQNHRLDTLPKTNIAPEHRPSQKETSIPTIHF